MISYFAYGSNLSIEQMIARTGSLPLAHPPRVARLPGYRLAFNMLGDDRQQYANIVTPGELVLGVVYRVRLGAMQRLDHFESGYCRAQVTVIDIDGVLIEAITYQAEPKNVRVVGNPSAEYVHAILHGGRQHGLPDAYIREIESLAKNTAANFEDGKPSV